MKKEKTKDVDKHLFHFKDDYKGLNLVEIITFILIFLIVPICLFIVFFEFLFRFNHTILVNYINKKNKFKLLGVYL